MVGGLPTRYFRQWRRASSFRVFEDKVLRDAIQPADQQQFEKHVHAIRDNVHLRSGIMGPVNGYFGYPQSMTFYARNLRSQEVETKPFHPLLLENHRRPRHAECLEAALCVNKIDPHGAANEPIEKDARPLRRSARLVYIDKIAIYRAEIR